MRFSVVVFSAVVLLAQAPPPPAIYTPTPDERRAIEQKTAELDGALKPLRGHVSDDLLTDVEVYLKAARWILRFNEFYSKTYVDQTLAVLATGLDRARQLAGNDPAWSKQTGTVLRAYRSRVDGSIQPYAVSIPENYSGETPEWLEVVLHGRGATLNEVSFLYSHARPAIQERDHNFIRLEVFGRGNNAYRWAGETDVFEAIDSVKKRYAIDPERVVLRGFSMGGAGSWHLGLHYPDIWAAVEAGAGFVETAVHAKVRNLPPYVHIYDAVDYAVNAVGVPIVGYGGEDDPQLRASIFVREALEREGYHFKHTGHEYTTEDLRALFLVGPHTQHRWEPDSKKKSDAFVLQHQSPGVLMQSSGRFVTYTEKYNRAFRITIDQLDRQYQRAETDWEQDEAGLRVKTTNIARITLRGERPMTKFVIDGREFPMAAAATFEKTAGRWLVAKRTQFLRKQHNLQGPIDDAFMDSFLCVNPPDAVNGLAKREFDRFIREFAKWMRGDVRLKDAANVTPADIRSNNIVIFGTPATNPAVARALRLAPVQWTGAEIAVGAQHFDARTHLLSLIYPNPDNPAHYVVINSGHTFHEAEFQGTNALLYPHVGDWAVTNVTTGAVVAEGVFDRNWRLPKP